MEYDPATWQSSILIPYTELILVQIVICKVERLQCIIKLQRITKDDHESRSSLNENCSYRLRMTGSSSPSLRKRETMKTIVKRAKRFSYSANE